MRRPRVLLNCIFCIGFLSGLAGNSARAQSYQVAGTVQATYYNSIGNPGYQPSWPFEIKVAVPGWQIKTSLTTDPTGDYEIVSFDGTNQYTLVDIEQSVEKLRQSGSPVGTNLANGYVTQWAVPHDPMCEPPGPVWLAYASAGYFGDDTNYGLVELPYWQMANALPDFKRKVMRHAKWTKTGEKPGLPFNVTFLSKVALLTNAVYLSREFTNFNGCRLPTSASLDIAYTPDNTNLGKIILGPKVRYLVQAESFKTLDQPLSFPPAVTANALVLDYRFNNQTDRIPLLGYYTDKRFLTKDQVSRLPENDKIIARIESPAPIKHGSPGLAGNPATNKWLTAGFMVFNVVCLSVIFRGKLAKNKTSIMETH